MSMRIHEHVHIIKGMSIRVYRVSMPMVLRGQWFWTGSGDAGGRRGPEEGRELPLVDAFLSRRADGAIHIGGGGDGRGDEIEGAELLLQKRLLPVRHTHSALWPATEVRYGGSADRVPHHFTLKLLQVDSKLIPR